MLQTRKVNPNKPYRIMVYGREGVGKSTLGARAERPLFITPEGGADHLRDKNEERVDEYPGIRTWDDLKSALQKVLKEEHNFKTLVLDSADWIETICQTAILAGSSKSISTVDGGYGAGYKKSKAMHKELLEIISAIRDQRNMNIIITAHAHVKDAKDPEMLADYDTYVIKCHEDVSSMWREWVDGLFFVRFKTFVKESDDTQKHRAIGTGERILYTVQSPAFQAKNRYGLPAQMPFTLDIWNELNKYISKGVSIEAVRKEITDMISMIADVDFKAKVVSAVDAAKDNLQQLEATLARLKEVTKKGKPSDTATSQVGAEASATQ